MRILLLPAMALALLVPPMPLRAGDASAAINAIAALTDPAKMIEGGRESVRC